MPYTRQEEADIKSGYDPGFGPHSKPENFRKTTSQDIKPRCLATIILGVESVHQIENYRWIRDEVIGKLPGGDRIIEAYYGEAGNSLVAIIVEHPSARKGLNTMLQYGSQAIDVVRNI